MDGWVPQNIYPPSPVDSSQKKRYFDEHGGLLHMTTLQVRGIRLFPSEMESESVKFSSIGFRY